MDDVAKVAQEEWTAADERAAIVAWLRGLENDGTAVRGFAVAARHACAEAIERGEHTENEQ